MFSTTHMQREITKLKSHLVELGAEVERSLENALRALTTMDLDEARKVVEYDHTIDMHEVDIEEECLKILALYQPVSSDLRLVVAILKINNDLERMADLAANVAEYVQEIAQTGQDIKISEKFERMGEVTREMVRQSLDSLVNADVELARRAFRQDDIVDDLNREIIHEVQAAMKADPAHMDALVFQLSASRNIERIADIATNVVEDVIYVGSGEIIRHKPEKR
mgnify:CR=1 FL=1